MHRASGIFPVCCSTFLLVGALPRGALPPWPPLPPGDGAGQPPESTGALPWGNVAGFSPLAPVLAVCLVLAIYNISTYLLSRSHDLPLQNTMPPTLFKLPDHFLFAKPALLSVFFYFFCITLFHAHQKLKGILAHGGG